MNKIRTRFAPSPTGFLHIGSLRTALYAYALAKHNGGDFLLRIEDTDQKREVPGALDALQTALKKFGLTWDEFYIQSQRLDLYKKAAEKLVAEGHAFYCNCKPKNAKLEGFSVELRDPCRDKNLVSGAIKLKVPDNKVVSYRDFVHKKEILWNTDTVYDATLLKSDGFPTYHLAAMVDDLGMKISHILRGHDWLPSTPIHLLVFDYLGGKRPEIGHLTDILSAETGKKLSKRRDSVFVEQFLNQGYLPEALLNFVMLLGWAPKDNRELFTLKEFVEHFDINGFQDANPRFFIDKLNWFNDQYKLKISSIDYVSYVSGASVYSNQPKFSEAVSSSAAVTGPRASNVSEFDALVKPFFVTPQLVGPIGPNSEKHLRTAYEALSSLKNWSKGNVDKVLLDVVKNNNFKTGDFFMDFRIAITGERFTMPINDFVVYYAHVFRKKDILERLKKAF